MPPPDELGPARLVVHLRDPIWEGLYQPIGASVTWLADQVNVMQFQTIRRYLSLMFGALHPGLGVGEGQVENQVGLVRVRFFTPGLRMASYDELNSWLLDRCAVYAKAHKHPESGEQTIWQAFEAERA